MNPGTLDRDEQSWGLYESAVDLVELVPAGLATCNLIQQYPQNSAGYLSAVQ